MQNPGVGQLNSDLRARRAALFERLRETIEEGEKWSRVYRNAMRSGNYRDLQATQRKFMVTIAEWEIV